MTLSLPHLNGGFKTAMIRIAAGLVTAGLVGAGTVAYDALNRLSKLEGRADVVIEKLNAISTEQHSLGDWLKEDSRRTHERLSTLERRFNRLTDRERPAEPPL